MEAFTDLLDTRGALALACFGLPQQQLWEMCPVASPDKFQFMAALRCWHRSISTLGSVMA